MNLMTLRWLEVASVVAGASFVALVAGCHNDTGTQERTSTAAEPTAAVRLTAASAGPTPEGPSHAAIPDADIAAAIERHLLDERLLRKEHVRVAVHRGVATLSGAVGDLLAKERAVAVAETIRGVRSVLDETSVEPLARTDPQLQQEVTAALARDEATRPYTIGAVAKGGTVTLSGTADSWQTKSLIAEVAKTVPGLKALVNAVTITYASVHPVSEIATQVRDRIANDAWLDEDSIVVQVGHFEGTPAFPERGTVVTLVGTVGSAAQKARARSDGWVAGVDKVDDEGVIVDWFARDDQRLRADAPVRSDREIARAVRDAFRLDPRLRGAALRVAVTGGQVALAGSVESLKARRAAAADAKDTLGVWSVRNDLRVRSIPSPADAELERQIEHALAADPFVPDGGSIQVSCAKGKVTLRGTTPTSAERSDVLRDATSQAGVSEVADEVTVTAPPADIEASIEERLTWDPGVQAGLVTVAVGPDRVATLTGTVDGWSERRAASEDAIRGGASRVVDKLVVRKPPEVGAPGPSGSSAH